MTNAFYERRARIRQLENAVVEDVVALRAAVTKAERLKLQAHMTSALDERDKLLAEVAA